MRYFLAVTVHRLIWWPAIALALPFALFGIFVDWLSETAFPAIANFVQPAWAAVRKFSVGVGNLVLGYTPDDAA